MSMHKIVYLLNSKWGERAPEWDKMRKVYLEVTAGNGGLIVGSKDMIVPVH